MLLGLRSIVYPAPDLAAAKAWFTAVLGRPPSFDQPFYVGFDVDGNELGLDPSADPGDGPVTYWRVADAEAAFAALVDQGATPHAPITDVGEGIRLGAVRAPGGVLVGVIETTPAR